LSSLAIGAKPSPIPRCSVRQSRGAAH
jgi:hypothetical protein